MSSQASSKMRYDPSEVTLRQAIVLSGSQAVVAQAIIHPENRRRTVSEVRASSVVQQRRLCEHFIHSFGLQKLRKLVGGVAGMVVLTFLLSSA